jgi:hypothetical protein
VLDGPRGQGVGIIEVGAVGRHSSSLGYDNSPSVIGGRRLSDDPGFSISLRRHDIIVENVNTLHRHLVLYNTKLRALVSHFMCFAASLI